MRNIIEIDTEIPVTFWDEILGFSQTQSDYLVFSPDKNSLTWFVTNYSQWRARTGNCEVASLYGRHISDLDSLCYQLSLCFPWGYRIKSDFNALYDLLLNFETEPERRLLFWSDAQELFLKNRELFLRVFERMAIANYCNRMGISTVKEDGSNYKVDQRTFFLFESISYKEVLPLVDQRYLIPSINLQDSSKNYEQLNFQVIELK